MSRTPEQFMYILSKNSRTTKKLKVYQRTHGLPKNSRSTKEIKVYQRTQGLPKNSRSIIEFRTSEDVSEERLKILLTPQTSTIHHQRRGTPSIPLISIFDQSIDPVQALLQFPKPRMKTFPSPDYYSGQKISLAASR
ncbi:uncharacterized protein LOC143219141 [Lasioglossum baleicum]|uniref:uncharacterized protein LOC143219141 n=1 Tax=Lasioglossum baleicum TaxID=434251 RepID=UPI003FCCCACD